MALTKISNDGVKKPIDLEDNEKVRLGTGNDLEIYHNGTENVIDSNAGNLDIVAANNTKAIRVHTDATVDVGFQTDDVKLRLGAGSDFQIYHDGSHSYINDTGTGELRLASNSGIRVTKGDSETCAFFDPDGASELYYDKSKKLETASNGINVTGKIDLSGPLYIADNQKVYFGNGPDLEIYHTGTDSFIHDQTAHLILKTTAANKRTYIQSDVAVEITTPAAGETMAKFSKDAAVELYYDNNKKLETTSDGAKITGEVEVTGKVKASNGYGSDGQVLTSKGGSANAEWADAGGGAWELLNSGSDTSAAADAGTIIDGLDSTYSAYKVIKIEFYIHFSNNTGYAGFQFKSGNSWNTANTYHSQCEYGRHSNSSHMVQDTNSNSSITINEDSNDRCENIAGTLSWYRGPNSEDAMLQWDAKGMAYSGANYDFFLFNGAGGNWDITNNQLQGIQWKNNTGSNVWWKVIGMK